MDSRVNSRRKRTKTTKDACDPPKGGEKNEMDCVVVGSKSADLDTLNVSELKAVAKACGIQGFSSLSKSRLIDAILHKGVTLEKATKLLSDPDVIGPTKSSSSRPLQNAYKASLSATPDRWKDKTPLQSKIVEYSESTASLMQECREENGRISQLLDAEIKTAVKNYPDCTEAGALFMHLFRDLLLEIVRNTQARARFVSGKDVDDYEVLQALNANVILNSHVVNNEVTWSDSTTLTSTSFTYNDFARIAAHLQIVDIETKEPLNFQTWSDDASKRKLYRRVDRIYNAIMRPYRRRTVCIDDDLVPTTSFQDKHEAALICILRKGGWGAVFDIVTDTITGTPIFIHLRDSHSDVVRNILEEARLDGETRVFIDRGYSGEDNLRLLRQENLHAMGPIKQNLNAIHNVDLYHTKSFKDVVPVRESRRDEQGIRRVVAYPGVGARVFVSDNESKDLRCYVAVTRTTSTTDGVVKFMSSTCGNADNDYLSAQASFVRIPAPVRWDDKKATLVWGMEHKEPEAMAISTKILEIARLDTVVQRDAAWAIMRKFSLTGSQAGHAITLILKLRDGKFARIRQLVSSHIACRFVPDESLVDAASDEQNATDAASVDDHSFDGPDVVGDSLEETLAQPDSDSEEWDSSTVDEADNDNMNSGKGANQIPLMAESATQPSPPVEDVTSEVAKAQEVTKELIERIPTASIGHKSTYAGEVGTRNEVDLRRFVSHLSCVENNKVYSVGLVRSSASDLFYCAVSPDDMILLTKESTEKANGLIPCRVCCVKYNTCMSLKNNSISSKNVVKVVAGSQEYLDRVPLRFRKQLLHQVTVLGISFALLVIGSPTGAHSSTLIEYEQDQLEEYRSLLRDDALVGAYNWFFKGVLGSDTDAELVERIPDYVSAPVRNFLESHVPLVSAVTRYRESRTQPIGPTKLFRSGIVNVYDIGKASTDTVCKIVAELMADRTSVWNWRQLVTMRYYYYALLATANLYGFHEWLKEGGDEGLSIHQLRAAWRGDQGRASTFIKEIARDLYRQQVRLRIYNGC